MASSYLGLSDLVTVNNKNANDYGVSDLFDDAPLLKAMAATVASDGSNHYYLKDTAVAGAGFRAINAGLDNAHSTDTLVTVAMKLLDGSFAVDKALADAYIKGPEAYIQRESRRKLRAAFFAAEQQIVGGTAQFDAAGFSGFSDSLSALANGFVVGAGGTTAATGSSVYLVRTNDMGTDAQVVIGGNGNVQVDQTVVTRIADATPKYYSAYWTPVQAWMGLQMGASYSVVRIANCTADAGKGLTDALIVKALQLFPASRQPNLIVMGRRSLGQLQNTRTSYNPTGAPSEIPNQAFNIPIVVTDAIGTTEALIS
jgi:hypothetical protein